MSAENANKQKASKQEDCYWKVSPADLTYSAYCNSAENSYFILKILQKKQPAPSVTLMRTIYQCVEWR